MTMVKEIQHKPFEGCTDCMRSWAFCKCEHADMMTSGSLLTRKPPDNTGKKVTKREGLS